MVSGIKPPWNVAMRYLVARKEALPLRKNCIAEMKLNAQIWKGIHRSGPILQKSAHAFDVCNRGLTVWR